MGWKSPSESWSSEPGTWIWGKNLEKSLEKRPGLQAWTFPVSTDSAAPWTWDFAGQSHERDKNPWKIQLGLSPVRKNGVPEKPDPGTEGFLNSWEFWEVLGVFWEEVKVPEEPDRVIPRFWVCGTPLGRARSGDLAAGKLGMAHAGS